MEVLSVIVTCLAPLLLFVTSYDLMLLIYFNCVVCFDLNIAISDVLIFIERQNLFLKMPK